MDSLPDLAKQWAHLMRTGHQAEAKRLGWDTIFPLAEEKFLAQTTVQETYDWLVLPAGLSPEYRVLLIKALRPKKVYFLGTHEFKKYALDLIIERTGLKPSEYEVETIEYSGMDVADVYQHIQKHLQRFKGKKVALDLTRGKRIMSAGSAIVGAFFGFDLVYIDEDWLDDIKRGVPGTERLVVSKNPFDVFGDLDLQTAHQLFNFHDYGAAMRIYGRLITQITDPRPMEIENLLAETYAHWNAFNFGAAGKKMAECRDRAAQYNISLPAGVDKNAYALDQLREVNLDAIPQANQALHVIADLYANALRKAKTGQFEDAIARLYRCLELMSQSRLATHGIDTSSPELASYNDAYKELTKKCTVRSFPSPTKLG
ncbi:MAG: TIGR02710 family CRISPR-associated CARF protein [Candidatus Woesearchaeota archaeon]|nr:TIGR02710 family CRISPR-associated CARF protein [Candidatus Woesearchaeota archaeon]MDP7198234.1 TIGR02710 family CRISPR-associated CARF protein [Candidatus Woesearchaeota archaeon]MDP7467070.1 TIGR02710 family CRISPR-associated CARF protein [Candidatus Woesearchaeota archaeon]MDP7646738.1 TIGR02710 family CRISPR-associated CARF protein [Candidatus Woesearchaeota archaeon]